MFPLNRLLTNEQQPAAWKLILRKNFTHWEKLADFLELTSEQRKQIIKKSHFPLNLPLRLAEKIKKGTLTDPILKQFLPDVQEELKTPGFVVDPVGDSGCREAPKLLHKYQGRVLLVTTSACAMHCRYCFRQNFDYKTNERLFLEELELIEKDSTIHEVILSGGDPLSLSDQIIDDLLTRLSKIPHVKRIRFHTRFPVGIPERIDEAFLKVLKRCTLQIWFVLHINHPLELDQDLTIKIKSLQQLGIVLLNQSVLLRDVNDDEETLAHLCEALVDQGVLPYYLHQLDRVEGASHFEVGEEKGLALIQALTKRLSGYAVPKYVREIPGELSKTSLV